MHWCTVMTMVMMTTAATMTTTTRTTKPATTRTPWRRRTWGGGWWCHDEIIQVFGVACHDYIDAATRRPIKGKRYHMWKTRWSATKTSTGLFSGMLSPCLSLGSDSTAFDPLINQHWLSDEWKKGAMRPCLGFAWGRSKNPWPTQQKYKGGCEYKKKLHFNTRWLADAFRCLCWCQWPLVNCYPHCWHKRNTGFRLMAAWKWFAGNGQLQKCSNFLSTKTTEEYWKKDTNDTMEEAQNPWHAKSLAEADLH